MQIDSLKLSELYASFLAALGGVSITVLTLVLTLYPKPVAGNLSRFWVAALFVATISCFIGAHLMAESAAFISKSKDLTNPKDKLLGERLSLLASINIYVAAMLLIFTLVLLTAAYIKWISVLTFIFVLVITLCWMYLTATSRVDPPHPEAKKAASWAIGIGASIGVIMGFWAYLHSSEEWLLFVSFFFPIASTTFSFCYFVWVIKSDEHNQNLNVWLYSFAITIPCLLLFSVGVGLVLR